MKNNKVIKFVIDLRQDGGFPRIQHYVIKFVIDLRQDGGFLRIQHYVIKFVIDLRQELILNYHMIMTTTAPAVIVNQ
jgi:hypothetical protein